MCGPYRARTKGKTESGVKCAKGNCLAGRAFGSLAELEAHIAAWLGVADTRVHGTPHEPPIVRFERAGHLRFDHYPRLRLRPADRRVRQTREQRLVRRCRHHALALAFDAGSQATLLCPAPLWKYGQQFLSYDLSQITAGSVPEPAGIAPTFAPPYIVPFDAFDHLERLPLSGCEGSLVGVGVFANGAAGAHRRIERLTLAGSSFTISELDTPFEVTTFDIVPGANADAIVGVVGRGSTGSIFASYRVAGCNDWSDLGSVPIDFDWRPAPAPGFGDAADRDAAVVPKTDGVQILGWRMSAPASNGYRFVHYDGYDIRSWTVGLTHGPTWTGSFDVAQFSLHADRNDLIAP